jgi:hypothetical protein
MVLQRKRFGGLGNDFAAASAASIDAWMAGCFSGLVLLVELRTVADFDVIAAPEERHRSPSFVRKPQPFHGPRVPAFCGQPAAWALRKDEGHVEICSILLRATQDLFSEARQSAGGCNLFAFTLMMANAT